MYRVTFCASVQWLAHVRSIYLYSILTFITIDPPGRDPNEVHLHWTRLGYHVTPWGALHGYIQSNTPFNCSYTVLTTRLNNSCSFAFISTLALKIWEWWNIQSALDFGSCRCGKPTSALTNLTFSRKIDLLLVSWKKIERHFYFSNSLVMRGWSISYYIFQPIYNGPATELGNQ